MAKIITINTAELAVTHNDNIIKTGSIGSCVAIALYDKVSGVGGLAHAMLPMKKNDFVETDSAPAKYVDQAIDNLVCEIEKIGGKKEHLIAKIVGGASMFKLVTSSEHGIGFQNISSAKKHLSEAGIPLQSEDTGGSAGKMVEFNLSNGILSVNTKL